jgi:hypothetical protein
MRKSDKLGLAFIAAVCLAAAISCKPAHPVAAQTTDKVVEQKAEATRKAKASEKEEEFASKTAAILLLSGTKCDLSKLDIEQVMETTDKVYDATGVHPSDYPKGEWLRKVFFTITTTDFLRDIQDDQPQMVKAFCKSMAEKFPAK